MALILLSPKENVSALKILVAAELAGVKIDTPPFVIGKDDQSQIFKEKSPMGRIPVLQTSTSFIFESNAILRYVARLRPASCLYGESFYDMTEVDQWVDFCTHELDIPVSVLSHGMSIERAEDDIRAALNALNTHLLTKTFIVGERITLADVSIACTLSEGVKSGKLKNELLKSFSNVYRWFETCENQKEFKKVLGAVKSSVKSTQQTPKKPENADEELEKKSEKIPNPLDLLPPTSLVLDEWKRKYSNTKKLYEEAMPWFWENYDPSGWSLWYMKYEKLEDECTVGFVTSNQLGGFFQRIDPAFRKYSFGVIDVVGKESDFDIQGVWMFRGEVIPEEMKSHPSFEYHKFIKLDHSNATDKKLIEDYWCADEIVEEKAVVDSKVWK